MATTPRRRRTAAETAAERDAAAAATAAAPDVTPPPLEPVPQVVPPLVETPTAEAPPPEPAAPTAPAMPEEERQRIQDDIRAGMAERGAANARAIAEIREELRQARLVPEDELTDAEKQIPKETRRGILLARNIAEYLSAEATFLEGLGRLQDDHPEIAAKYLPNADEFRRLQSVLGYPLNDLASSKASAAIRTATGKLTELARLGCFGPALAEPAAAQTTLGNLINSRVTPLWGSLRGQVASEALIARSAAALIDTQRKFIEAQQVFARANNLVLPEFNPDSEETATEVLAWIESLEVPSLMVTASDDPAV